MATVSPEIDLTRMAPAILDGARAAITVFDLEGRLLYYNHHAPQIVDRKPEYIGRDIRSCHSQPRSVERFTAILESYQAGKGQEFYYTATRNGRKLSVKVAPLIQEGRVVGGVHTVMALEPTPEL
ncbi:MAG: PAS domain-containing protein [Thermodesulfobacteriota bacterium]